MMRARRGSALILVLMMTLAVAGLSIAAIFMSSSAALLSAFYDRERDYRLSAEAALEITRSRLMLDTTLVVPDTGFIQLAAGLQIERATGGTVPRVSVNVYAATTGDTLGLELPVTTLIALAYDASGVRHVRRMDLRRESFSRFAYFVDSFPSSVTHGPGIVHGRVHSNGSWWSTLSGNTYNDTVSVVSVVGGGGTFFVDSMVGVNRIAFPTDSSFPWLDTLAAAGSLAFTPVSTSGLGSRLEFVSFDADADGTVEDDEGFVRVFDLTSNPGIDTSRLRGSPTDAYATIGATATRRYIPWFAAEVQNQCGAFYHRSGRWHFFPVSTHRAPYAQNVINVGGADAWPSISIAVAEDYDGVAVEAILSLPTARCFPAGSPYLMPAERMTDAGGQVTGTGADVYPFGVAAPPPGGWPTDAPFGYGGSDTTFTERVWTCDIATVVPDPNNPDGLCESGTLRELGRWRAFPGTPSTLISTTTRQERERAYLWPTGARFNPTSRGVVSSRGGPLFVSGEVAGRVTLRVDGRASIIDELVHANDPNDPARPVCRNTLGLVAVGDVLVVEGLMTRVRHIAGTDTAGMSGNISIDSDESVSAKFGAEGRATAGRFRIEANLMSTGGTVGVENPGSTMGANAQQIRCPENTGGVTASNGGCLLLVGGAAMRTYSALYSSTSNAGFRYHGARDRCQYTDNRPPFFPLTNRYRFVRTLEIEPSLANTPTKIRALLLRLKGKVL